MVLPQSVAPSAILRRSSTRFNLAVRDMTIRRAQSPSRCSPLWRRSNSSPDRPAKTAARTHDESCYELVSLNCAVSQNCAPPPPDGLRQNKDEGAARPDDRVRVPRRVRPLPSLFLPFGQRSLSANCVEKLCLIEAPGADSLLLGAGDSVDDGRTAGDARGCFTASVWSGASRTITCCARSTVSSTCPRFGRIWGPSIATWGALD